MKKESCENHEQTLLLSVTNKKGLPSMSIVPKTVRYPGVSVTTG